MSARTGVDPARLKKGGSVMVEKKYPHLFSPIRIGSLTLKNGILSAPNSLAELSPQHTYTPENIAYYALRARGGAALVTVGDCVVHPTGRAHVRQAMLCDPDILPSLTELAEAIHANGALASVQLDHGGKQCYPEFVPDGIVYDPSSEIDSYGDQITEMSNDLIAEVVASFADAAATAKLAGFDMCQVHAGHNWLLCQFLSPLVNRRTDEYGGSLENRARLAIEVLDAIRAKCSQNFPIELRISAIDAVPGGITLEDAVEFCRMVESRVDLIHVSAVAGEGAEPIYGDLTPTSMFSEHGRLVPFAAKIKEAVTVPVGTVGGLDDPAMMEEIIESGKADVVNLGRALIADPFLPHKALLGKPEEITPCLRCSVCMSGMNLTRTMRCTVNPIIGHERDGSDPGKASQSRRVLVVGGGPGGMQAAITAAQRGHQVTLCESTGSLGGAMKFAEYVDFKHDLHKFRENLEYRISRLPIDVRLHTEMTPSMIREMAPEVLITALGAEPIIPPIPGVRGGNVVTAAEMYTGGAPKDGTYLIIGGGLIGCETALELASSGKTVTIMEMLDTVAPDANLLHRGALMPRLEAAATLLTGTRCIRITEEGAYGVDRDGREIFIPADRIVISAGLRPKRAAAQALCGAVLEHISIGDCVKTGNVTDAIRQGFHAARNL